MKEAIEVFIDVRLYRHTYIAKVSQWVIEASSTSSPGQAVTRAAEKIQRHLDYSLVTLKPLSSHCCLCTLSDSIAEVGRGVPAAPQEAHR
ncbi:MAG: hypothetical protein V1929_00170 [bacterium]